ncbi:helix-turn-helix transcriptional regulator [Kitasatospora sp. Root107]|uniref:helix-turn-helix transcriptional regulator n=1 Tax=Kitasatospora sp. Root107 TaxID=1736424 RepID=UPI00070F5187|nr:helix-turn-helix transcriptional regulator [Kitasatospora sp. Root107]KQV13765.1 AraC family transcriptional regulator [Kitasatospora sp. Root107]
MQAAVERAIATMWDRYEEPLSLDDIADTAILSKFYFSRVFRTLTGTSPGRFLSAIRLHKAKHLLLRTELSVTDISYQVGYNSLGTFTSRFTRSVGLSPGRYRTLARTGIPVTPRAFRSAAARRTCVVRGSVGSPEVGLPTRIYVAAFTDPIVQGEPVACDILDGPGEFQLSGIQEGVWHLRAAVVAVQDVEPQPWKRSPLFIGSSRPVTVRADQPIEVDLETREFCPFDLPILLALPELDCWQLPQPELASGAIAITRG